MILLRFDIQRIAVFILHVMQMQSISLYESVIDLFHRDIRLREIRKSFQIMIVVLHRFFALILADLAVRQEIVDSILELHCIKYTSISLSPSSSNDNSEMSRTMN